MLSKTNRDSIFVLSILSAAVLFIIRKISQSSLLFEQVNFSVVLVCTIFLLFRPVSSERFTFVNLRGYLITGLAMAFLLNTLFLNIDRSRSFYVLAWVSNGQVENVAGKVKVSSPSVEAINQKAAKIRIEEAQSRGLLDIENNQYRLTLVGELLLSSSNILANLFELEQWKENTKR
jgi:hypothetical protein